MLGLGFAPMISRVDCWIGIVQTGNRRVVRLAGHLSDVHVPDLLRVCSDGQAVDLDVTDLVSADAVGIDSLRRLRDSGATVIGAHGNIQLKLDLPSS
jgi:hypothetical protein